MQNKINTIIGLGVLVLLLPILGLPQSWDNFLYIISGLVIIATGISIRLNSQSNAPKQTKTFEENNTEGPGLE